MAIEATELFSYDKEGMFSINFDVLEELTSEAFRHYVVKTLIKADDTYLAARINNSRIETTFIVIQERETIIFKYYPQTNTFENMRLNLFSVENFYFALKDSELIEEFENLVL